MTTSHDDYAAKSVLHSDKSLFTDAQQAEARVCTWLAGASESFAREDIELLLNELGRRQTTIEMQERELHRLREALTISEDRLSIAQEGANEEALRAEQANIKALLENIEGAAWSVDTNYCLIAGNSTFHRDAIQNLGRDLAAGDCVVVHDELLDLMNVWKSWYDRALSGEAFAVEVEHDFDSFRRIEYRFNPIRSTAGAITGVTAFGRDSTAQKRAEALLREQLSEITNYYDNAPVGLAVFDMDLRYLRINNLLATANGFSPQEHLGKTIDEILPDLSPQIRRMVAQILATGEPVTGVEFSRESHWEPGSIRTWLASWHPIKRDEQEIVGFQAIVQDITERKRAQESLYLALKRLDAHMDNSPLAVIEFDPTWRIIRWSESATRVFGWTQEEMLGKHAYEANMIHEDDVELVQQAITAMSSGDNPRSMIANRDYRKDGKVIECEWYGSIIYDDDGQVSSILSLVLDITERKRAEESLRRSEHSLAEAQRLGHSGSWEYDLATQTATWSENMFRIFDVDPLDPDEAALKDDIEILVHPEDRDYVRTVREEALQGKRPYDLDYRIVRKDGTSRILHSLAEIVRDERGAPVRMVGRVQDITERKQAEDRLRRSEHRLLEAQRIGSFGSWEVDLAANTLTWSENLFHIYDLEPGEPSNVELEHAFHSVLHPDDLEYVRTVYAEALQGKRPYDLEYRIVRKDGSIRAMHAQAQVERDAHGQAARVIGNVQDITERKQMIEALRRSEASMRALLDNTNDLISSRDLEGRLVLFNNSTAQFVQKLLGVEARPGLDTIAFLPEIERAHWKTILANVYAGADYRQEFTVDSHDGTRYYDMSLKPIWSEGQVIGLTDFTLDITDRKREEAERERMRGQLVQAQKMETVGRLAGGIAHEFNNLLAVILMRTELSLPLVTQTDPLYRNLTTIQTITKRSAELVQQLLGFARKQMISPKVLDLNTVVDTALPMVRRLVGEEIRVVWRPGAPLCRIKMDQAQIEQVVVNLCLNARDAIDGFGVITIETHNAPPAPVAEANDALAPSDSYVMLAVTDTGRGMDQETLEHIFEPFYTMNEFGTGSGLGLAMVDGVVQQNHGRIEVSSALGQGATFKIFLPCHVDSTVIAAPNQSQPVPVGHGETVLLVEDEPDVLQIATDVLEYLKYKVIAVKAPAEALDHIQHHAGKIDVLMTDVVMPAMNGAELANRIVALQPEIKCLFMSGYPTDAITHRGVLEGRAHFLQKPYTVRALAGKLREVLEEAP